MSQYTKTSPDFSRKEAEKWIEISYGPVEAACIMQSPWQVIKLVLHRLLAKARC